MQKKTGSFLTSIISKIKSSEPQNRDMLSRRSLNHAQMSLMIGKLLPKWWHCRYLFLRFAKSSLWLLIKSVCNMENCIILSKTINFHVIQQMYPTQQAIYMTLEPTTLNLHLRNLSAVENVNSIVPQTFSSKHITHMRYVYVYLYTHTYQTHSPRVPGAIGRLIRFPRGSCGDFLERVIGKTGFRNARLELILSSSRFPFLSALYIKVSWRPNLRQGINYVSSLFLPRGGGRKKDRVFFTFSVSQREKDNGRRQCRRLCFNRI